MTILRIKSLAPIVVKYVKLRTYSTFTNINLFKYFQISVLSLNLTV